MSRALKLERVLGSYQSLIKELADLVISADSGKERAREPWMSIEQAAAYVGVEPGTIRSWISGGELEAGRFGKVLRVRPSAIDALLTKSNTSKVPMTAAEDIVKQLKKSSSRGRGAS